MLKKKKKDQDPDRMTLDWNDYTLKYNWTKAVRSSPRFFSKTNWTGLITLLRYSWSSIETFIKSNNLSFPSNVGSPYNTYPYHVSINMEYHSPHLNSYCSRQAHLLQREQPSLTFFVGIDFDSI